MALIGITSSNADLVKAGQADKAYNVIPLAIASVMMLAAPILFAIFKRRRYIGIIMGIVAAAVMLMVALDLGRAFPVHIASSGDNTGLSTAKLIWRHIGIAIVPLFMAVAWLAERAADKAAELANKDKHGFDLSGDPLFKDLEGGIGEPQEARRLKRSLRKRMEKYNS